MGLNIWRKMLWVLLFFSLALNLGFIFTAVSWKFTPRFIPPPMGPGGPMGPGPSPIGPRGPMHLLHIIDRMDLPEAVRDEVVARLQQMEEDRRESRRQFFEEEKKVLAVLGKPGNLDMEMMMPLIEAFHRSRKQSALKMAAHLVEIRNLLGREKSLYLMSEVTKELKKRVPWDKPID